MSGKSSGGSVAFVIEGFVLKRTETGTEPGFFLPPENRNRNRDEIFGTAQLYHREHYWKP